MTGRRFRLTAVSALFGAVVLAGSAVAYVCHPAARGVRDLTIRGSVVSLATNGRLVRFVQRIGPDCTRVVWNTHTGAVRRSAAACPRRAARWPFSPTGRLVASADRRRVVVVRARRDDRPDVLAVYARTGKLLRTLPLPARPETLAAARGLAIFSAPRHEGVFAVRLADGLYSFLGPDGRSFSPRLDARGVVFHDAESKRALREGRTVIRFVPRRAIARSIADTARPLVTGGRIRALAMDGPRVALAVADRARVCDRVVYWNVAWRPAQRVSAPSGPTCVPGARDVGITALAIGGFRTAWLVTQRTKERVVAGSPLCQEWVVQRMRHGAGADPRIAFAGDGRTLAFATTTRTSSSHRTRIDVVAGNWRRHEITSGGGAPRSLAASGDRVAILWPSGDAEIVARSGAPVAAVRVGAARGIALEGHVLAVMRTDRLDLYDIRSRARTRSVQIPAGARSLDLHYGLAAFVHGREALVVDTGTGRTAVVGRAPARLIGAQIERPGLAYAWATRVRGVAMFVPMSRIYRDVGRGIASG